MNHLAQDLAGRTALVTGASKNIGEAIALAFADAGAAVAVIARTDAAGVEAVASEVRGRGVKGFAATADVGDPTECESLVADVVAAVGNVDYFISNAAHRPLQDFLSISVDDWNRILGSNLSATFYLSRLLLPSMVESGFGRVIAIGGPDGQAGASDRAHNVTCKAGIIGLVKAIAIEFGRYGVTANVVSPGFTDTSRDPKNYPKWPPTQTQLERRLPIPRLGRPEEIADACVFLATEKASYITGQTFHISGGLYLP